MPAVEPAGPVKPERHGAGVDGAPRQAADAGQHPPHRGAVQQRGPQGLVDRLAVRTAAPSEQCMVTRLPPTLIIAKAVTQTVACASCASMTGAILSVSLSGARSAGGARANRPRLHRRAPGRLSARRASGGQHRGGLPCYVMLCCSLIASPFFTKTPLVPSLQHLVPCNMAPALTADPPRPVCKDAFRSQNRTSCNLSFKSGTLFKYLLRSVKKEE